MWHNYGDVVRLRVFHKQATVFFHPEHAQHILQKHHMNYDKQYPIYSAVKSSWQWALSNDGPSWLHQRRLIQPIFHRKMSAGFGESIVTATQDLLDIWRETIQSSLI